MKLMIMNKTMCFLMMYFSCNFLFSQISIVDTVDYYENVINTSQIENKVVDSTTIYKLSSQEKIEIIKYSKESSLSFFKYSNTFTDSQIIKKTSKELRKYYLLKNNEIIQELILLNTNDTLKYLYKINDSSYYFYYNSGSDITKKSVDKYFQDNGFYEIYIFKDSCRWKGSYIQIKESEISSLDCIFYEQKKNNSNHFYHFIDKNGEKTYTLEIGNWLKYNNKGEIIERKFYDYSNCLKE